MEAKDLSKRIFEREVYSAAQLRSLSSELKRTRIDLDRACEEVDYIATLIEDAAQSKERSVAIESLLNAETITREEIDAYFEALDEMNAYTFEITGPVDRLIEFLDAFSDISDRASERAGALLT